MSHLNRIAFAAIPAAIAMISVNAFAATAWNSTSTYVAGDVVTYSGKDYKAKWWTQGNVPGAEQWGPWEALSGGTVTPTPTTVVTAGPTATTAPTATTPPAGACTYAAWNAATAYNGGALVSSNGRNYKAQWWTQGNEPATNVGSGKPWLDLGPCDATATPTPTATKVVTPTPTATTVVTPTPTATSVVTPTPTKVVTPTPTATLVVTPTPTATSVVTPTPTKVVTPTPTATTVVTPTPTATAVVTPTPTPTGVVGSQDQCRPAGLVSDVANVPYCNAYDTAGREKLANNMKRRSIGYFTNWRTGKNGQPAYLGADVPWGDITHVNYAFAHVNDQWQVSIGNEADPNNSSVGMEWPEKGAKYALNPNLPYKGHFNMLKTNNKNGVKLLLSVGGWAETGGFFNEADGRTVSGGFYALTTDPVTGAVRQDRIDTFAKSAAAFVKKYGFDGIDIDYEYPTSMNDAGNPEDWKIGNARRGDLWKGYMALMKTLRNELDKQAVADNKYYMLTIASPSSGYLLRGMEDFEAVKYLDYVNMMTYDLHGAWNHFVGHNAALYDTGKDNEIADAKIYSGGDAHYYNSQGYLNIDWAYKYFRTALAGGRINIGLPYYTRGSQNVTGGTNGLWGISALADQTKCYLGTGGNLGPDALSAKAGAPCGFGAQGIDNLWFDRDAAGNEMFAGVNPLWHVNNLRDGLPTPYVAQYGHDVTKPANQVTGSYIEYFDDVAKSSWLWNPTKKVFLSTENEKSFAAKVQYAIDQGAGGIMFWEMAGDYSTPAQNGTSSYGMGSYLTALAANKLRAATPYGVKAGDEKFVQPADVLDVTLDLVGFKPKGDDNYPLAIGVKLKNNSNVDLTGAKVSFNVAPSTPLVPSEVQYLKPSDPPAGNGVENLVDIYSGGTWSAVPASSTVGNVGGLPNGFHRLSYELKAGTVGTTWGVTDFSPGKTITIGMRVFMPLTVPSNVTLTLPNGKVYGIKQ
ncbi:MULTISPECIES: glycosyl hydrolase family 18 protein [Deefgea]|nr:MULTISPECIES: glycosyl hydrolase family 18 protein [Deefgea]MBM9889277.1 chitinase C-terminal domain-containing protein [Deefgea sp. CFH1-16]